jgi:MoxR-like ATPase
MSIDLQNFASELIGNVEKVIIGKREQIELMLAAMLCQGHILLEDVPGTGKTMLANSMAISMGIEFKRLQCTPDLLPTDITGLPVFLPNEGKFKFQPGPVFTHILLADEINRATPRTQSALLEAMQECRVTVGNTTYSLSRPFMVMATQNPIEYEGTFPLPEAQLDRFIMRISMGYAEFEDEREIIKKQRISHPIETLRPVVDGAALVDLGRQVSKVHVDSSLEDYALKLVKATREHPDLMLGASSRGVLALYKTSQAWAALKGRDYVVPDDMKKLAPLVLNHRLLLKPESQLRGNTVQSIMNEIISQTEIDLGEVA